ncbi:MAG: hypothetical protein LBB44_01465 [Endomicrobium sp.]|jgi:predicted aspartyl protease|nr:hypothetical protein [Endomicrobium sp.]
MSIVLLSSVSFAQANIWGDGENFFSANVPSQKSSISLKKVAGFLTGGLVISAIAAYSYITRNQPVPMYNYLTNKMMPEGCIARSIIGGYSDWTWTRRYDEDYQVNDAMVARFVDTIQKLQAAGQPIR